MSRKPVFRIVKSTNREWYTVERRALFGWQNVVGAPNLDWCKAYVAEAEANPTGVIYQTGKN